MTTHPDPNPMTDEQTKAGAVLPKGWTLTCPYPEAMELKFAAPGGGYQTRYYTVRGEGIIYAFLKALHESTPQPPPEQAGSVVPEGYVLVRRDDFILRNANFSGFDDCRWCGASQELLNDPPWSIRHKDHCPLSAAPAPKETP